MPQYAAITVSSIEDARALASFPVAMPSFVPAGYELRSIRQLWPPHISDAARQKKVHADFVDSIHVNAAGDQILITQGFFARLIGTVMEGLAPADSSGTLRIGQRDAVWLTAQPMTPPVHDGAGRRVIPDWKKNAMTCVGWLAGTVPPPEGGRTPSSRYYAIEATALSLDEVIKVAESVS